MRRRDSEEALTPLGHVLGSLPMSPQLGKMVMYGILLGCVDPALTLACAMAYRSPFLLPMNDYEKAQVWSAARIFRVLVRILSGRYWVLRLLVVRGKGVAVC